MKKTWDIAISDSGIGGFAASLGNLPTTHPAIWHPALRSPCILRTSVNCGVGLQFCQRDRQYCFTGYTKKKRYCHQLLQVEENQVGWVNSHPNLKQSHQTGRPKSSCVIDLSRDRDRKRRKFKDHAGAVAFVHVSGWLTRKPSTTVDIHMRLVPSKTWTHVSLTFCSCAN